MSIIKGYDLKLKMTFYNNWMKYVFNDVDQCRQKMSKICSYGLSQLTGYFQFPQLNRYYTQLLLHSRHYCWLESLKLFLLLLEAQLPLLPILKRAFFIIQNERKMIPFLQISFLESFSSRRSRSKAF